MMFIEDNSENSAAQLHLQNNIKEYSVDMKLMILCTGEFYNGG